MRFAKSSSQVKARTGARRLAPRPGGLEAINKTQGLRGKKDTSYIIKPTSFVGYITKLFGHSWKYEVEKSVQKCQIKPIKKQSFIKSRLIWQQKYLMIFFWNFVFFKQNFITILRLQHKITYLFYGGSVKLLYEEFTIPTETVFLDPTWSPCRNRFLAGRYAILFVVLGRQAT